MTPRAPLVRVAGWAAGTVVTLLALAASGHGALSPPPLGSPGRWQAWMEQRQPAVAAFALLRMAAVAGCWYLAGTAALGAALRLVRAEGLVRVTDRLTVAPVRRLLAGSLTLSLAGIGPTGVVAALAQSAPTTISSTTSTSSVTTVVTPPATITMRRLPLADIAPDPPSPQAHITVADRWTVQPGDCFWTIADDLLTRAWGRAPTDAEIVPYWLRLVEANRSELADPNNADLIFPGQVFSVPPVPPAGDHL